MASSLLPAHAGAFRPSAASAFTAATSGMQAATASMDADAQTIAAHGPDVSAAVDLDVQGATYSALATVIRAEGEMTRSAVDLLA